MANYMNSTVGACTPATFNAPDLPGATILSLNANLVTNFSSEVSDKFWYNHPSTNVTDVTFCNVTVTYMHADQGDNIKVAAWLPTDTWNQRMQAVGGGGWVAGGSGFFLSSTAMAGALGNGYATVTTDAGQGTAMDPSSWGLLSNGSVNNVALKDLSDTSLIDEAILVKAFINDYYGMPPKYSYWSGCSQGGRQGVQMAQNHPDVYDGIAASAPALNFSSLTTGSFWPQLIMNLAGEYPQPCELDYITAAAVSACDDLDGVADGVISNIKACKFDPFSVVGSTFNCPATNQTIQVSKIAATVTNATWGGPKAADGSFLWYGLNIGADISGTLTGQSVGVTTCSSNGTCVGVPNDLGVLWISLFLEKNPDFDFSSLTHDQYAAFFAAGREEYGSVVDTYNPDLAAFKAAGGKMIAYHGMVDQLIPTLSTEGYYDAVTDLDANVHDFYRYFEAPGIQHCSGGDGGQPTAIFDALVAWVENGTVPETLPVSFTNNGTEFNHILCPYPAVSVYDGVGEPTSASSFSCC